MKFIALIAVVALSAAAALTVIAPGQVSSANVSVGSFLHLDAGYKTWRW